MTEQSILYEMKDGWAKVTLNRPDKLNSFNEEMHHKLRAALSMVKEEGARCLLLVGAGKGFCAGQDLGDRKVRPGDKPLDLGHTLDTLWNPLIRKLTSLEMPVICAVHGAAAGAGANIALACDIVLAAKDAKFVQAFSRIGLIPDSGGTWALPRLVGQARAMGLALLADTITGEEAAAWGLIWKALPAEDLMPAAENLAALLATKPTTGLAFVKQAIRASFDNTLDAQLDLERDLQRKAGRTHDYREGVAAFLEKRQAKFQGK